MKNWPRKGMIKQFHVFGHRQKCNGQKYIWAGNTHLNVGANAYVFCLLHDLSSIWKPLLNSTWCRWQVANEAIAPSLRIFSAYWGCATNIYLPVRGRYSFARWQFQLATEVALQYLALSEHCTVSNMTCHWGHGAILSGNVPATSSAELILLPCRPPQPCLITSQSKLSLSAGFLHELMISFLPHS